MREISRQREVHIDRLRLELLELGFTIRTQTATPNVFCYDPSGNEVLEAVALGLWLGEGTRDGRRVELSNCDPSIIRTWIAFLLKVCHVEVSKLRLLIDLREGSSQEESRDFWVRALGYDIPCSFNRKSPCKGNSKWPMGVARLRYHSKFLQQRIQQRAVELTKALM